MNIINVIELSQHLSGRIRLEKRGVPKFLLETSFPWKLRYGAKNAQDCASRSSVAGYSTDWKGWLHRFEFGEFESIVDCNRFDWIDCSRRARLPDDSWCYVPRPRDKALHRMIPWPVGRQTRIADFNKIPPLKGPWIFGTKSCRREAETEHITMYILLRVKCSISMDFSIGTGLKSNRPIHFQINGKFLDLAKIEI